MIEVFAHICREQFKLLYGKNFITLAYERP
jgi:hypothetical protein